MSDMMTQRLNDLGQRLMTLGAQMSEVHPDSPEAEALRAEALKLQEEMNKFLPQFLDTKPWWFKPFLWCVGTVAQLTQPIISACYRLYHMAKGLM